jgi:hypothetical protein
LAQHSSTTLRTWSLRFAGQSPPALVFQRDRSTGGKLQLHCDADVVSS